MGNLVSWKENDGIQYAYYKGKFAGLVSQNPPGVVKEGLWQAAFKTTDEGLIILTRSSENEALDLVDAAITAEKSYDQWKALG